MKKLHGIFAGERAPGEGVREKRRQKKLEKNGHSRIRTELKCYNAPSSSVHFGRASQLYVRHGDNPPESSRVPSLLEHCVWVLCSAVGWRV